MFEYEKEIIVIELDGDWVLEHPTDDKLPIDVIKAELSNDKKLRLRTALLLP